jgi:hypothetical protein
MNKFNKLRWLHSAECSYIMNWEICGRKRVWSVFKYNPDVSRSNTGFPKQDTGTISPYFNWQGNLLLSCNEVRPFSDHRLPPVMFQIGVILCRVSESVSWACSPPFAGRVQTIYFYKQTNKHSTWPVVRKRTIPTERPPLVGEVSANFCGQRVSRSQRNGSPWPLISVS